MSTNQLLTGTRRSSRAAFIGSLLVVLTPKLARWFPLKVEERDVASQRIKPLYSEKEARCRQFTPSGFTYLFDQIGGATGIAADLKTCFPDSYRQIQSIVYYLILENRNLLFRFAGWAKLHKHPYGENIPSQRSSEIFQSISEKAKMRFFRLQGRRRAEKECWAYDTTSISSCSQLLKQVKYGKNKDNDKLLQINLALLFGEESGLLFYYRKLSGNIPDVKTVNELVREPDVFGYGKLSWSWIAASTARITLTPCTGSTINSS